VEPHFHRFPVRTGPRLGSTTDTEDIHHKDTNDTKKENFTAKAAKAAKTDLFKTEGNEGLTKESVLFRFSGFIVVSFRIGDPSLWPLRPLLCKFPFLGFCKKSAFAPRDKLGEIPGVSSVRFPCFARPKRAEGK
jgi:hypothetical protein